MGRRGKAVTASVLAGLTLALAFVVLANLSWLPIQDTAMVIIPGDHGILLDESRGIQEAISDSILGQYRDMLDGALAPQEYVLAAETASEQATAQIRVLVTADAPPHWAESYGQAVESLRAFNSMIRETIVHADMVGRGDGEVVQRIEDLRRLAEGHADMSEAARP